MVKFLNAKPLDYGIRIAAKENKNISIIEDIPSRLAIQLLNDELDIALISSVEYIRNKTRLNCIESIGVCAAKKADSLFYIKHEANHSNFYNNQIDKLYIDEGSRSTAALLKILYLKHVGQLPQIVTKKPQDIPDLLSKNEGGLLIGDEALRFVMSERSSEYSIKDLISWWYESEQLPFVTAVWAYSKNFKINEKFFLDSLRYGSNNISTIARQAKEFPDALNYLTKTLYYNISKMEKKALQKFEELLIQFDLL